MYIFKDKWEKLENEFVSVIVGHTQVRVGIPKFWNLVPKKFSLLRFENSYQFF